MSSPTQTKAKLETAKTTTHAGVGAAYATLGTPLAFPAVGIMITSSFDKSCWISTDGSSDQLLVAAGSPFLLPLATLAPAERGLVMPKGTQFYIKQGPDGAPTTGDIAITGIYGA